MVKPTEPLSNLSGTQDPSIRPAVSRRSIIKAIASVAGCGALITTVPLVLSSKLRKRLDLDFLLRTGGLRHMLRDAPSENAGWYRPVSYPVLGGTLGTCFDACVLRAGTGYRMWFSWRPRKSIAFAESADGIHWSTPVIMLEPRDTGWEDEVNRPVVIQRNGQYQMWYTGQTKEHSYIGFATSPDGITWTRPSTRAVLAANQPWEGSGVCCPHVLFDDSANLYKMWYSAGEHFEPNAIGYATSSDGVNWNKYGSGPVFQHEKRGTFDQARVTACCVVQDGDWYVMFYAGFANEADSAIGLARSHNGIDDWQHHPSNPILAPTPRWNAWDRDAIYKPTVVREESRWMLWYNGRRDAVEQIGLAEHSGTDLGFPAYTISSPTSTSHVGVSQRPMICKSAEDILRT